MEVARLLWEIGPATVRQIHEAVCNHREADFATVQTFLRRIEAKGYATSTLKGRTRIYAAKAKPKAVIRETVDDLVDRLFGGDTLPLVRHLIEERGISPSEVSELRELIESMDADTETKEGQ